MDIVNIRCSECGRQIGLQRQDLGHKVRCPLCQKIVLAALPSEPKPAPAAPPAVAPAPAESQEKTLADMMLSSQSAADEDFPTLQEHAEGESIFEPPEDVSDDLFGEGRRLVIDIPPVEALAPPGAHAVAPNLPPLEIEGESRGMAHHFPVAEPSPPSSGSGEAILADHPEHVAAIAGADTHLKDSADHSGSALPAPAPTLAAKYKSRPSFLVPLVMITLVPYSIFATGIILYLLYQQRNFNPDPNINYLEKMIEESQKKGKEMKRVQHDLPLPKHLRVALHGSLDVGAIEVKPLKVSFTMNDDLILFLRLKNISGQNGTDKFQFNPLPDKFGEFNHKKIDTPKPYIFLEAGNKKLYGAKVQRLVGDIGQEKPAGTTVLDPGQEFTMMLVTLPEDRKSVKDILKAPTPLLWRVQFRRGLEKLRGEDWIVTCVVGVEFNSKDIVPPDF